MAIHSDSNDKDIKLCRLFLRSLCFFFRAVLFHNRYIVYTKVHKSRLEGWAGGGSNKSTPASILWPLLPSSSWAKAPSPLTTLVINYRQNNKDKLNMGTKNVFVTDDTSPVSITKHQEPDLSINFTGLPDVEGGVLSSRVSLGWLGSWFSPVLGDIFHNFIYISFQFHLQYLFNLF